MKCPICGEVVANVRGLASHFRHQSETHPDYSTWKADQKWSGKVEGVDYVRCRECGHRGASLARHLKAAHSITADEYRARHPGALIRPSAVEGRRVAALREARTSGAYEGTKTIECPSCGREHEVHKLSGVVPCSECKTEAEEAAMAARGPRVSPLRGRKLPAATRKKMSENAGRWNKGLTKEDHPSLARAAEKMAAKVPWNAGLTAEEDPRVAETARKLRMYTGEGRPWDNGLAANLTLKDFEPFMDSEGVVDHHRVVEATGVSWRTVRSYIRDLGLGQTSRYKAEAAEDATIRLDREVLEQFRLGNGKVSIGKAMSELGHCFTVVKRECRRHGLPTFHRRISQTLCLEAVSKALGGLGYKMEWQSRRFTNPPTGYMFRFDGYFPDVGLIVEFHGHQHYTFPNAFMIDEGYLSEYEALRERDRIKRQMIEAAPDLRYLEVREDEPYEDVMYLRGRLHSLGLTR